MKTGFIIKWPDIIDPRSNNKALTQYVDVVPTLLEAVGATLQANTGVYDTYGRSEFNGDGFLDILKATASTHCKYVFGVHTTRGILDGCETYPIRSFNSKQYLYIGNFSFASKFKTLITVRSRGRLLDSWYERDKVDRTYSRTKNYMMYKKNRTF